MPPRILVIGLDAATLDLIEPWLGRLPALAGLVSSGFTARFLSTPNMHSASSWTSILTGLNPGRHGLFVFSDRDFETGKQLFFKGGDRSGETIGAILSRHGLTSGFVNVPMTYPAESTDGGFMISGLDAPSLNADAFRPEGLRDEILGRFPDYTFSPPALGDMMRAGKIDSALTAWIKLIETQTSVVEYLLEHRPVDFLMTVYTASDWGGHNLWRYIGDSSSRYFDSLLSIYIALDSAIGRLLAHAGENTQVYVISDHGMGAHSGASYHLSAWLEKHGYMARNRKRQSLVGSTRKAAQKVLPASLKDRIKKRIGDQKLKQIQAADKDTFYDSIDWQKTTAYSEPGRHVVNINLAGRNPAGIVRQSEYDSFCETVIGDLRSWMDIDGIPVVERVAKRCDVYQGDFVNRASDLHIYWNPTAKMGPPPEEVKAREFWWSGDHRPEGILICRGPGIRRGAAANNPIVYDLVPTLLHLAGLPIPEGLDGRAIEELCTEEVRLNNPVRFDRSSVGETNDSGSLSESDEKKIEEKLRALGYL